MRFWADCITSTCKSEVSVHNSRPTFEDAVQRFDFKYILSLDDVVASPGGIPLIEDGKTIGAIGWEGSVQNRQVKLPLTEWSCALAASWPT